jgi:hypothetical protein
LALSRVTGSLRVARCEAHKSLPSEYFNVLKRGSALDFIGGTRRRKGTNKSNVAAADPAASKRRKKGQVVEIVEEVVFGEPEEILRSLGADSGGNKYLYIERLNLSIRNSLARFIRRGMNCSKDFGLCIRSTDNRDW